jgi:hypothetical protein
MHGKKSAKLEAQSLFIPATRKKNKKNMLLSFSSSVKVNHGIMDQYIDK